MSEAASSISAIKSESTKGVAKSVVDPGIGVEAVDLKPYQSPAVSSAQRRFARWAAFRNFGLAAGAAVGSACYIYLTLASSIDSAAARRARVCAALKSDSTVGSGEAAATASNAAVSDEKQSFSGSGRSSAGGKQHAQLPTFRAPSTFKQLALHSDVVQQDERNHHESTPAAAAASAASAVDEQIESQSRQSVSLFSSVQHFQRSRLHEYIYDVFVNKWNSVVDGAQVSLVDACVGYAQYRRQRAETLMKEEIAARLGHHDVHDVAFVSHAQYVTNSSAPATVDASSDQQQLQQQNESSNSSSSSSLEEGAAPGSTLRQTVCLTELKPIGLVFPPAVVSALLLLNNDPSVSVTASQQEELLRQLYASRGLKFDSSSSKSVFGGGGSDSEGSSNTRAMRRRMYDSITNMQSKVSNMRRTAKQIQGEREAKKLSSESSSTGFLSNSKENNITSGFFGDKYQRVSDFLSKSKTTDPHEVVLHAPTSSTSSSSSTEAASPGRLSSFLPSVPRFFKREQ